MIGGSGKAGRATVRELLAAFYPGVPLRDGKALQRYQSVVETLRAEIGADPAPETTALYQQLRRGDVVV